MSVKLELDEEEYKIICECLRNSLTKTQKEFLLRLDTENRVDALKYDGFRKKTFDELKKLGYIQIVSGRVYEIYNPKTILRGLNEKW